MTRRTQRVRKDHQEKRCMKIDFKSPIPFYIQLMDVLRDGISSGNWQPGDQLPGEHALCKTYGVSRTVVRQSLRELELEGLIYRRKGKGSYVAEPKISEGLAQKLTGFYQDMEERGHNPISQVLKQAVIPASTKIAQHLEINPGTPVVELERLRFVQDEPIVLVTSYLPHALCPGLENIDLTERSLYTYLETTHQLIIARGIRYIEAVAANNREAELLQVPVGSPLILLDSVSFLEDNTPLEYYHALHHGNRTRLEVALVHVREQGQMRETLIEAEVDLPSSNTLA
jgi:GntR family transcriptional regulator